MRISSVSLVCLVLSAGLFGAAADRAAAYEVSLSEYSSESWVFVTYNDDDYGEWKEAEDTGGASATASVQHTDGSIYSATRSISPLVSRVRVGDLVTTTLMLNMLGSVSGVSFNDSAYASEAVYNPGYADVWYLFTIASERSTPPASDLAGILVSDEATGWADPLLHSYSRRFDLYEQAADSTYVIKLSWSDGFNWSTGNTTFEMGRGYAIRAQISGSEYGGQSGNFFTGTDSTIAFTLSENVPIFVPEPATWALLLGGGLFLAAYRPRRRR